jgi:type VI secretion system protein VasI
MIQNFTAVLLITAMTLSTSALAQGTKELARCSAIKNDAKRLSCFDDLAKKYGVNEPIETTKGVGKWVVRTETSPIDDSTNVYLSLAANNFVQGWLESHTPKLMIRCKENKTEAFVVTGMQATLGRLGDYGGQYYDATIRFDKNKATDIEMSGSTDGKALFFSDAIGIVKQMMTHQSLLFQFTPFNASPVMTTFDIRGLKDAIKPLRKECHW